jgi:sugar phosphate isomerase/epimerase
MSDVKIALQLYTVRDHMEKDVAGTLKKVKEIGFDYVEPAGYFNKTAEEFKALLDEADLVAISTHYGIENLEKDLEGSIAYHKTIGTKYIAIPWMDRARAPGGEKWEDTRPKLEKFAAALQEQGLQLLYHNHDFEYELVDGKPALDLMYQALPNMWPEFDTCWVKYAGFDPVSYINAYKGKVPIVHLKDFVGHKSGGPAYALIDKDGKAVGGDQSESKAFAFRPLGQGIQNIPAIVRAGLAAGTEVFVVEQDDCYGDSLGASAESRAYLRSMGY